MWTQNITKVTALKDLQSISKLPESDKSSLFICRNQLAMQSYVPYVTVKMLGDILEPF